MTCNRHVGRNIRLIVVNNGRGQEFCNYAHAGSKFGGEEVKYIAAAGHFGKQSPALLKHYSIDLGFEYLSASNKEEFLNCVDRFTSAESFEKPIVFEIFTNGDDESEALKRMYNLEIDTKVAAKQAVKSILGDSGLKKLKKIIKH